MSQPLLVYAEGTPVRLPNGCEGRVMGVMIKGRRVSYQVVWWQEDDRKEEWLHYHEVKPAGEGTFDTIGFHPAP